MKGNKGIIVFIVLCLMMAMPAKSNAQDVLIEDLSILHEMIEGRTIRARYIFLENFLCGEKGLALYEKTAQIIDEHIQKNPLSYDPQKILDEFRKYAIGRRSWLDAKDLGDGYFAVRNRNGWGVMRLDGSFVMPLGSFQDYCSINREKKLFSAWKQGDNTCGIFTYDGQEVSEFKYSHVMASRDGFAIATLASGCEQVLLIPEGSGQDLFYKTVSDPYYAIRLIECYDENDNYYPIFSVMETDPLRFGVIDRNGKLVIPMKYNLMDRTTGRKFGHDPDFFMYLRARRSEGEKEYYDYFYVKSMKLVYTCEVE